MGSLLILYCIPFLSFEMAAKARRVSYKCLLYVILVFGYKLQKYVSSKYLTCPPPYIYICVEKPTPPLPPRKNIFKADCHRRWSRSLESLELAKEKNKMNSHMPLSLLLFFSPSQPVSSFSGNTSFYSIFSRISFKG